MALTYENAYATVRGQNLPFTKSERPLSTVAMAATENICRRNSRLIGKMASSMRESMDPSIRARWAAVSPDSLMTVDELMALPADRWRYELVAGRLVKRLPTDVLHEMIERVLRAALETYALASGAGGVVLTETGALVSADEEPPTVLVPTLGYVRAERMPADGAASEAVSVRVVPDLVVEMATPGSPRTDLAERARVWLAAGAQVVWVIWPNRRQVDIWRPGPDALAANPAMVTRSMHESIEGDPALPGFTYPVAHLFS